MHAVSHRSVAAAANVPLGSTTYHFRTLDDLLSAAMEQAAAAYRSELDAWEAALPAGADLAAAFADYVLDMLYRERPRLIAEYELYLASLWRPLLAPAAASWAHALSDVLERRTDATTARTLTMIADGALMHTLATRRDLSRDELVELLRNRTR